MNNWIEQEAREHQAEMAVKREAASLHEGEQTEKTLHHLAGRVEELRARLERVLIPIGASGNSLIGQNGQSEAATSPLTARLKSLRKLAQGSIDTVEDILNRLDI